MSRYWVKIEGFVEGPFEGGQLRFVQGFGPETLVSAEESGDEVWVKAADVGGLLALISRAPAARKISARASAAEAVQEPPSQISEQVEIAFPLPPDPFEFGTAEPDFLEPLRSDASAVLPEKELPPEIAKPAVPAYQETIPPAEPAADPVRETSAPDPVDNELLDVMGKLSETLAEEKRPFALPPVFESPPADVPAAPPPSSFTSGTAAKRLPPKYVPRHKTGSMKYLAVGAVLAVAAALALGLYLLPEFFSAGYWRNVFAGKAAPAVETVEPVKSPEPPAAPAIQELLKPAAVKPVPEPASRPVSKPQAKPKPPARKKEAPEPELKTQKYLLPGVPAPSVGRSKVKVPK